MKVFCCWFSNGSITSIRYLCCEYSQCSGRPVYKENMCNESSLYNCSGLLRHWLNTKSETLTQDIQSIPRETVTPPSDDSLNKKIFKQSPFSLQLISLRVSSSPTTHLRHHKDSRSDILHNPVNSIFQSFSSDRRASKDCPMSSTDIIGM